MRNIETRSNKIGPDDEGLNQMLTEAAWKNAEHVLRQWLPALIAWRVTSHRASLITWRQRSCCALLRKTSRTKRRRFTDG
ncbi:Uncharacterised protein [Klebsiella pneumoniae]|uniref:Uncharacterized protein n=1 Tax=Klebsiella pneumoniae TaxID=573 RepID=A0A2X3IRC3_KLEPN|nr:Uncharacterised protein [Klebsiella pneumoniae]